MRNAGIAYNPSAEERAEDEAWLAARWAEKHPPTIPTQAGVASARNTWEREMFSHPEDADRYLEVLALMESQRRDDKDEVRPQKFGGHYVFSLDPGSLEERADYDDGADQPTLRQGTTSTPNIRGLRTWGRRVYGEESFPKAQGRLHYEDVLAAFFEAAVKRVQPRPRQNMDRFHEALREVQYDRRSVREVGKAEGVTFQDVSIRRKRAVAQLVETISPDGLEGVARELVWFMKANNVNLAYLPEWVRYRAEGKH